MLRFLKNRQTRRPPRHRYRTAHLSKCICLAVSVSVSVSSCQVSLLTKLLLYSFTFRNIVSVAKFSGTSAKKESKKQTLVFFIREIVLIWLLRGPCICIIDDCNFVASENEQRPFVALTLKYSMLFNYACSACMRRSTSLVNRCFPWPVHCGVYVMQTDALKCP